MGHKGTFGKVLCVCGSVGFSGAAVFAGQAAVRTGSGLVYLGVPEPVWPVAAMKCDEVMPFPLPSEEGKLSPWQRSPSGGGPGLRCGACGLRPGAQPRVRRAGAAAAGPAPAPGAGRRRHKRPFRAYGCIVPAPGPDHHGADPHEGEVVRAGGDLSPGRERAAADFAREHGVYLVLGPGTIAAAPDGRRMVNSTGNCGMA